MITQAQYDATCDLAKRTALQLVIEAARKADPAAMRGAAIGVTGKSGIQLPAVVLSIGLAYGNETGVLSTHRHDLNWYAAEQGHPTLPGNPGEEIYYVACFALRPQ